MSYNSTALPARDPRLLSTFLDQEILPDRIEGKFFDRLAANYATEQLHEHSVFRYLRSLESNKSPLTIKAYHTQVMAALRDFLYSDYDLPSPQFDDVAALLIASEICRRADKNEAARNLDKNDRRELESCLSGSRSSLQNPDERKGGLRKLKHLLPDFEFNKSGGRLKMSLRGETLKFPRSELKRDDETVLNIILSMLDKEKDRRIWPHLFKLDVVGHVIGIGKTVRNNRPATLNLRHSALSSLEEYLYHSNELRQLPVMIHLSRMRNPVRQKPVLSKKQIETILRHCIEEAENVTTDGGWVKSRNLALIALLDNTLLRAGAVCNIKLRDLDLIGKQIYVPHEKGGKNRILDINPFAYDAVTSYLRDRKKLLKRLGIKPSEQEYLFLSKTGRQLNPRHFDDVIHRTARNAGVRKPITGRWGPHSWRHSMATQIYIESDGNISVVQGLLGHSSPGTSLHYVSSGLDEANRKKFQQYHPRSKGFK